jgi:hypothetical protein
MHTGYGLCFALADDLKNAWGPDARFGNQGCRQHESKLLAVVSAVIGFCRSGDLLTATGSGSMALCAREALAQPDHPTGIREGRNTWKGRELNRQRNEAQQQALDEQNLEKYQKVGIPFAIKEQRALYEARTPQVAIRDANKQFIERIAGELPPPLAEQFRQMARAQMYRFSWVETTPADKLIAKVLTDISVVKRRGHLAKSLLNAIHCHDIVPE